MAYHRGLNCAFGSHLYGSHGGAVTLPDSQCIPARGAPDNSRQRSYQPPDSHRRRLTGCRRTACLRGAAALLWNGCPRGRPGARWQTVIQATDGATMSAAASQFMSALRSHARGNPSAARWCIRGRSSRGAGRDGWLSSVEWRTAVPSSGCEGRSSGSWLYRDTALHRTARALVTSLCMWRGEMGCRFLLQPRLAPENMCAIGQPAGTRATLWTHRVWGLKDTSQAR